MQPFLKNVAEAIAQRFGDQLYRIAIVFPNRRQIVFFRNYLQQILTPPAFLPELLTIEELIERSSSYTIADHFTQSFELYKAYTQVVRKKYNDQIIDYEKFYAIGDILLRDFEELDASLSNIDKVFEQLKDIESIEKKFDILNDEQKQFLKTFWSNFSAEKKSAQQQKFLHLWEMLPTIYQLFHQLLSNQQLATQGMAYRKLVSGETRKNFIGNWNHIAFVSFNALNKAEETILQQWQKQGKASLWVDADEHYVVNQQHEAGYFIRKNLYKLKLQNELPLLKNLATANTQIHIIATQGAVTQAKLVPQWLSQFTQTSIQESVAIILADEGLLLPVLQSLPPEIRNVNVTMGYPLQQSILFSFIQLFFDIQIDLAAHHDRDINYKLVHAFLQHPLCDWQNEVKQYIQQKIIKEVLLRYPLHQLKNHTDIGNYIFTPVQQSVEVFDRLSSILEAFHYDEKTETDYLLKGLSIQVWETIQRLKQLFITLPSQQINLTFLAKILRKQLASITVPFEGEPLNGIQIMGLLESRGLDFDHIIVLSANEGILPRVRSVASFLPDSIRRAFGLRVFEHQDAIFAYAFYRLLHWCKHMTITYNAIVTDNSTGELTRFVPQLAFETKFKIENTNIHFELKSKAPEPIIIEKTPEVMKQCNAYFASENPKTLSPSAINSYLHCQLQFYFRYIAKLKEPDEVQDQVDAMVFGNIVHTLMELLYKAVRIKNGHWKIVKEDIIWMKTQIPTLLQQAFIEGWREKTKEPLAFSGKLLIVAEIVKQYANAYLEYDAANTPFEIEALETDFKEAFHIKINNKVKLIYLSGYIDRVDIVNGVYRMVDYKTGSDQLVFPSIEKLFERTEKKRNKAALQTLIYAWSFSKKFPDKKRFAPVLLPLRVMQEEGNKFVGLLKSKPAREPEEIINADNITSVLQQLEIHLKKMLEELFDVNTSFTQTDDWEKCTYCPYIQICERN